MKVAYMFCDFGHDESKQQRELARRSIVSVRKHIPSVEIVHLTDEKTPALEGADSVLSAEKVDYLHLNSGKNRADLHAMLQGEVLFLDTDTILTMDVSDVFDDKQFDIALRDKEDGLYNQGVVFSRNTKFWEAVSKRAGEKKVYGELGFTEVVDSGEFKIKTLGREYNYWPPASLAVFHFKGQRKKLMISL